MPPELNLSRRVAEAFYGRFTTLRPHQQQAIGVIGAGGNLILSASTGSGKTEAVVAPLVDRFMDQVVSQDASAILYIVPTKALVNDIEKRLTQPLEAVGWRVGVRHGDRDDLHRVQSPHIVITTPESFDVLMARNDSALTTIQCVVVDEVHLFYNTQRGLQLSILLRRLSLISKQQLQLVCLSATIAEPTWVRDFLFGKDVPFEFISNEVRRPIRSYVRILESAGEFVDVCRKLLGSKGIKLLVFANTRRECERLAQLLQHDANIRVPVVTHYSSLSAEVRQKVEHDLLRHSVSICIATSTLELGIDVGDIDAAVLYGPPASLEGMLQRIGRSNRRSGRTDVICLVPETSEHPILDALLFAALISLGTEGAMAQREPYELFGAVAQQHLSAIASRKGAFTRVGSLAENADHLDHVPRVVTEQILSTLATEEYLTAHGFKNQYGAASKLYQLIDYRMIYGNFAAGSQEVEIRHRNKELGSIPADNLMKLAPGDIIRFAGRQWQIRQTSRDGIQVEPSDRAASKDIAFSGVGESTDPFLLDAVWKLMFSGDLEGLSFTSGSQQTVCETIRSVREACEAETIPVISSLHWNTYITFAGTTINTAIGLLLSPTSFIATPLSLQLPQHIQWAHIPSSVEGLQPVAAELGQRLVQSNRGTIYQSLLPVRLRQREELQTLYRDHVTEAILERLSTARPRPVDHRVFAGLM